jgi:uncharacterized protein (DUF2164 family)
MATNFQSSFIPKEPITEQAFKKKKTGLVGILAVSLFLASIAGAVGMYFYEGIIKNEITSLEAQLAEAEKNVDKETIKEMSQFGQKLSVVKSIIYKHQVISNFLDTLAASTVSTVQFTDFSYGNLKSDSLTINLRGKASSYAAIAVQENVLLQNKYFKSITFSNLGLSEKGLVSFDLALSVDPQISVYAPDLTTVGTTTEKI